VNPFLTHLVLGSLGLALAGVVGGLWLWFWRKRPLASYRLVCALCFGALLLPLAQVGMERWQAPKELGLVQRLASIGAGDADETPVPEEDPLAGLGAAELDALVLALAAEPQYPQPLPLASAAQARPDLFVLLVGVYLAGVAFAFLRLGRRLLRTRRLLRDAAPVTEPAVLTVWRDLSSGSPLRERLELRASPHVQAPVCFGLTRPVVVLPQAPLPEPDVLRCVLLHELVHLERRDTWVMLAQEFFRAVFWFHPAAWWLCRKLDALRELSCDLLVVQRTGRRKRYAQALLEYADVMARVLPSPSTTALLPWSGTKSQLSRRIEMLVSLPSRRTFPWTTVPVVVSLVAFLWTGQLAVAASLSPAQDAEPPVSAAPTAPANPAWPLPPPSATPAPPALPALARPPQAAPAIAQYAPLPSRQDTPTIGVYLGEDSGTGIRVNQVMKGSLAERHELQAGDVIVEINGHEATRERLERAKKELVNGSMTLTIRRGDRRRTVVFNGHDWPRADAPRAQAYRAFQQARARTESGRNEIQQARLALERALRLNPDDADVRRALESLMAARDVQGVARDRHARARGDYETALRTLKQYEGLKEPGYSRGEYRELPADGYRREIAQRKSDLEKQRKLEADRQDRLEAQLRSTEFKLQQQMRELEELRARIRALRNEQSRHEVRGGGGQARSGWVEPVPVEEIIEEPVEPVGRSIARELADIRQAPPAPEPVEPPTDGDK